jgi:hypothetical protein
MPIPNLVNVQETQLLDLQDDLLQLTAAELIPFLQMLKSKGAPLTPVLSIGQVARSTAPLVLLATRNPAAFDGNLGAAAAWSSGVGIQASGFASNGLDPEDMSRYAALVGWVTSDRATTIDFLNAPSHLLPGAAAGSGVANWINDIAAVTPADANGAQRVLGATGGNAFFRFERRGPFAQIRITNAGAAGNPAIAFVYGSPT